MSNLLCKSGSSNCSKIRDRPRKGTSIHANPALGDGEPQRNLRILGKLKTYFMFHYLNIGIGRESFHCDHHKLKYIIYNAI